MRQHSTHRGIQNSDIKKHGKKPRSNGRSGSRKSAVASEWNQGDGDGEWNPAMTTEIALLSAWHRQNEKMKKKKGRYGREGGMFTYTGRFGDLDLRGRLVAGKWLRRHRVDEVKIINLEREVLGSDGGSRTLSYGFPSSNL